MPTRACSRVAKSSPIIYRGLKPPPCRRSDGDHDAPGVSNYLPLEIQGSAATIGRGYITGAAIAGGSRLCRDVARLAQKWTLSPRALSPALLGSPRKAS